MRAISRTVRASPGVRPWPTHRPDPTRRHLTSSVGALGVALALSTPVDAPASAAATHGPDSPRRFRHSRWLAKGRLCGRLPLVRSVAASRVALNPNQTIRLWQSAAQLSFGVGVLALVTLVCVQLGLNLTTAAFAYLIAIVLLSIMGGFTSSAVLSIVAVGCLNYFFASPVFNFRVEYPLDAVVVISFLITSLVVTGLVRRARSLAEAALNSQKSMEGTFREVQALREQFRLVIDTIPAVVWRQAPDGSAEFLNQRFREYTGLSLEEGRGWGWMNAFHPEDRAMDEWRAALAAGEPFEKEARLRRADGEYRWSLLRAVPLRERGNIVKWYGTTIDIEDRKRAEGVLRDQARLLDLTHDTVFVRDMTDVITYWNRGAEELYGWTNGQAVGNVPHELLQTSFPEPLGEIMAKLLQTRRWEGELVHTKRDGTQVIVASRWALQQDEHGRPVAILETNNDISERKQAEEALRRQANLLEQTHDAILVWRFPGTIIYWSRGAERLYGFSSEEATGRVSHELLRTEHPMPAELFEAHIERHGTWSGELTQTTRDGRKVVVDSRHVLVHEPDGHRFVLETNRDITERRQAADALRESEERWRAVFENNPTMYFMVDAAGTVLSVNPFGAEQLGCTVNELVGHSVLDVFYEPDRDAVRRNVAICFERLGRTMSWEFRKVRKNGTVLWVRETARAMLMKDRPVVLIVCEDITERKQAEYLTGQVFESSPDGISIVGRDFRYQRVNPVYEQHWAMPAERMVGMHIADLVGTDVFEQTVEPLLYRCFEGEEVSYAGWFTNALGRFYLGVTCSPLRPDSERVEAALLISRDLTEHVLASEALREAQAALTHVTRVTTLGEVTASFAHELNQPLAAILNNANACLGLLPSGRHGLDEVREALADIVSDADRASAIIERVRGLAKRTPPEKVPLRLVDVVDDIVALAGAESVARGVAIRTDVAADLPVVLGDRVQLLQVLLNLVVNGMDAMSTVDEPERRLEIGGRPDTRDGSPAVRISVQDRGVGLDAAKMDRLFEGFYTTKPHGMGMGLAISRSIIQAHGGRLWAESNQGPGATFSFSLPAAAAS